MPTINVTADHIRRGKPGEARCCPIALAMWEAGLDKVSVSSIYLIYRVGNLDLGMPASAKVYKFVDRFDKRLPVEPFSFFLP